MQPGGWGGLVHTAASVWGLALLGLWGLMTVLRGKLAVFLSFFFFLSVLFYFPKNPALWLLKEANGQDGYRERSFIFSLPGLLSHYNQCWGVCDVALRQRF